MAELVGAAPGDQVAAAHLVALGGVPPTGPFGDVPLPDLAVGTVGTPVGTLSVVVSPDGVTGVCWGDHYSLVAAGMAVVNEPSRVAPVLDQLSAYFAGELHEFDLTLDLRGLSRSRRMVLQTLYGSVPYGSSITYGELAHRSATGVPARGIGAIMGSNPLPILIPCHRVLAQNGLGGYSGGRAGEGLETKRWLLTMEGVPPPPLDWIEPTRDRHAAG
jgi:methylated-DNA-[protein]-cysteine S-methyltransferase